MMEKLLEIKDKVKQKNPLIHCLTNSISITDCANAILAVGGNPIMAEHPDESAEITSRAAALLVNLGNIRDSRMKAMLHSGKAARAAGVPIVMDLVGVGSSRLRLAFANRFISRFSPDVIKGNLSEIKTICGQDSAAEGVGCGRGETAPDFEKIKEYARICGAVLVITGKTDIVTDGKDLYFIKNGTAQMAGITGTGCVAGALIAAFLSVGGALESSILALSYFGVCGEFADTATGPASFKVALFDWLFCLQGSQFLKTAKIYKNEEVA